MEAVDAAANRVTIAAPGLVAAQDAGDYVSQAPLVGDGDSLVVPGAAGKDVQVLAIFDYPQKNGNPSFYNGRSQGRYYRSGDGASWLETLANYSAWWVYHDVGPSETFSVGLLHTTASLTNTVLSVELNPATGALALQAVPGTQLLYVPRVTSLIVAGG